MKEYCIVRTRKPVIICVLHFVKYQFNELSDTDLELIIKDWLEKSGSNAEITVSNKDFDVKYDNKNERIYCEPTQIGFDIILEQSKPIYSVEDCTNVCDFNVKK